MYVFLIQGTITYSTEITAWEHLLMLLNNARKQIPSNENDGAMDDSHFSNTSCKVRLVGFSKGCVVLNQLLYEMPALLQSKNQVCE